MAASPLVRSMATRWFSMAASSCASVASGFGSKRAAASAKRCSWCGLGRSGFSRPRPTPSGGVSSHNQRFSEERHRVSPSVTLEWPPATNELVRQHGKASANTLIKLGLLDILNQLHGPHRAIQTHSARTTGEPHGHMERCLQVLRARPRGWPVRRLQSRLASGSFSQAAQVRRGADCILRVAAAAAFRAGSQPKSAGRVQQKGQAGRLLHLGGQFAPSKSSSDHSSSQQQLLCLSISHTHRARTSRF